MTTVSRRRVLRLTVILVLAAAVVAGLWSAARPAPTTLADQVVEVSAGLACPSCAGQSVADSESDLARQMREIIAAQLRDGRSPDEIHAWFAERYGEKVLLDPPGRGVGLVLVMLPLLLVGAGGVLLMRQVGGRRGALIGIAGSLAVVAGLIAAGAVRPLARVEAGTWSPTTPVASASTADDASHQALQALQSGDLGQAKVLADQAMRSAPAGSRAWQDALLVVALVQHERGDAGAARTLQRFLDQAPDHPAAPAVRRLLQDR